MFSSFTASLRNFGERTANLFRRKKNTAEQNAQDLANETEEAAVSLKNDLQNDTNEVAENTAALKNIGEKTSNLFERKKKEVGELATEKATEAQTYAEEQAKKVGDSIEQTKKEAGEIIGGTAEEVNTSINNGAEALDKTKQDLNQLAEEATTLAGQAKATGATALDHAKGAVTAAVAAGSKAAEGIVDQKLKEGEHTFDAGIKAVSGAVDQKIKDANAYAEATRDDLEKKIHDATINAHNSAGIEAANLMGKLNLARPT